MASILIQISILFLFISISSPVNWFMKINKCISETLFFLLHFSELSSLDGYHQGPDFDDKSSFFPCEIDDAIQYINLGYGAQTPKIVIL